MCEFGYKLLHCKNHWNIGCYTLIQALRVKFTSYTSLRWKINLSVNKHIFEDTDNPAVVINLHVLWKSAPVETQCLMCHTQRHIQCIHNNWHVWSFQFPNPKQKFDKKSTIRLSVLEQKVHLRRCTFCQKIGGCGVMKNHTIVQLDWVPHLQHSHKVTHTFLKTLWRHGALQHLIHGH